MKSLWAILLIVNLASCMNAARLDPENSHCAVPHRPIRWQAAYCMAQAGTEDLEAIQNAPCMTQKAPAGMDDVCRQNAYWKEKWCKEVIHDTKGKSVGDCVKDRAFEPQGVAGGF